MGQSLIKDRPVTKDYVYFLFRVKSLLTGSTILTNTCLVLNPFVMIIGTIRSDVNTAFIWSLTLYIVNIVVWFY